MKAIIEIDMDNAAFEDNGRTRELRSMLRKAGDAYATGRVRAIGEECRLLDENGNTCGRFEIID